METYVYSAGVTVASCLMLTVLAFKSGMSRGKNGGVKVLETYTTTNETFIIANRIHLNMMENMVVFLPLLWLATIYSWANVAAGIGAVWLLARGAYIFLYTAKTPGKRAPAFVTSFLCQMALAGLSLYGLLISFV